MSSSSSATTGDFKFVLVPCDDNLPIKQLLASKSGGLERDALQKTAKELFSVGNSDSAGDKEQRLATLKSQLLSQGIDPATVDSNMLSAGTDVANMNPIEILTLILPTKANDYVGVSMYCDANASVKHRPVNRRATSLARHCGLKELVVVGDAFFGKCFDNEDYEWERKDLTVEDVTGSGSSEGWLLRTAAICNKGKDMSKYSTSGQMQQFMQANSGGGGDRGAAGAADARLTWTQSDDDVDVQISLPAGTAAKDLKVLFTATGFSVVFASGCDGLHGGSDGDSDYSRLVRASAAGEQLPTFGGLIVGDCTWCLDAGGLTVTLTKSAEGLKWLTLFK